MAQRSFDSIDAIRAFVGQPAVNGRPVLIEQPMIDAFAGITQDHQWIHVDAERAARESPYKNTIAHGLLTLSLITAWYQDCFDFPGRKLSLNYGFDKIRFTSPVPCGSRLVGSFRLDKAEDIREGEVRCHWTVEVKVEGAERPALVAVWLVQMRY